MITISKLLLSFIMMLSISALGQGLDITELQNMYSSAGDMGELSLTMRNSVTGNMPELQEVTGLAVPPLGAVNANFFKIFSQGVFAFAVIAGGYAIIMGTIGTATEGEAMGKKLGKDKFFLFFRTATSFMLFLPTSYGYSTVQLILNSVAVQGVALANGAWQAVATAMLTYGGGVGNIIIGSGGLSQQYYLLQVTQDSQQTTSSATTSMLNDLSGGTSGSINSQFLPQGTAAGNIESAYLTSFLVSSQCVMNNLFPSTDNSGSIDSTAFTNRINAIINDYQQQVIATSCYTSPCTISFDTTDNSDDSSNINCGTYQVQVLNQQYAPTIANMLVSTLQQITNQTINFYYPQLSFNAGNCQGNACWPPPDTDIPVSATQIGNTLFSIANSWVSQTQYYAKTVYSTSNSSTAVNNGIALSDLMNGGWAMAASNYYYYSTRLGISSSSTSTPSMPTTNQTIVTVKNVNDNGDVGTAVTSQFGAFVEDNLKESAYIPVLLPPSSQSSGNGGIIYSQENSMVNTTYPITPPPPPSLKSCSSSSECMQICAQNFQNCSNFFKYIGGYSGSPDAPGGFSVGQHISYWYDSFSQLDGVSPQTFAQLESNATVCGVPFGQPGHWGSSSSTTGPVEPEVAIPIAFSFAGAAMLVGLIPFFKPIAVGVFGGAMLVILPFAFMASTEAFTTLIDIFTDPSKLYPKQMAMDLQSFCYFMAKAWIDVFGWNQQFLFTHPITAISTYGALLMQNGVAFIVRIGTDSFNSNMSASFNYFIQKILIALPMTIANLYSKVVQQYGDEWLLQPVPMMDVQWFQNVFQRAGVPLPPFLFIIWIIFIPIPVYLIIGAILKVVGIFMTIAVAVAQVFKMVNMNDFLLEIQLFITSLYNPIYFAISVPTVVLGATFAYMLPLYPIVIYAMAVVSWVTFYVEAILATPIILFGMANPKGQGLLGDAQKVLIVMMVLFLKPVLTVLGFLFANILTSFAIIIYSQLALPLLNNQIGNWVASSNGEESLAAVMTIMGMVMFVYVYYQIITFCFALIYKVPNSVFKWVGHSEEGEDAQKMEAIAEQFTQAVKEVGDAGPSVAGKGASGGQEFGASNVAKGAEADQKSQAKQESEGGGLSGTGNKNS